MTRNGKTTPVPNAFTTPPAWTSQTRPGSPSAMRSRTLKAPDGRSAVGVRVAGGVSACDGLPLAVAALRAGREMLRRPDVDLVTAVGAPVCAGRDVAAGGNRVRPGSAQARPAPRKNRGDGTC